MKRKAPTLRPGIFRRRREQRAEHAAFLRDVAANDEVRVAAVEAAQTAIQELTQCTSARSAEVVQVALHAASHLLGDHTCDADSSSGESDGFRTYCLGQSARSRAITAAVIAEPECLEITEGAPVQVAPPSEDSSFPSLEVAEAWDALDTPGDVVPGVSPTISFPRVSPGVSPTISPNDVLGNHEAIGVHLHQRADDLRGQLTDVEDRIAQWEAVGLQLREPEVSCLLYTSPSPRDSR